MTTTLNGKEVIIEGIDYSDVPDFSDAYVLSIDGREPTREELDELGGLSKIILIN